MSIEAKFREYIDRHGMLEAGDLVVAGVSGGADSMCMLKLLMEYRSVKKIDLLVVHINHGIRGESAARDEQFVADFCERNGLEFTAVHADIPKLAKDMKLTCEEAGRNFRYDTFGKMVGKYEAAGNKAGHVKVAVAHNSDDNAETVLFNLFRGSGITGMCGIRPVRSRSTAYGDITIIRPVLCLSRAEIEEYLEKKAMTFCTDETNLTNDYSRNCIRNLILPKAKELLNENIPQHLAYTAERAAEIDDFLSSEADLFLKKHVSVFEKEIKADISALKDLHSAVRGVVLRKMICSLSKSMKDIEQRHIELLWKLCQLGTGKKQDLPYELKARTEYGFLYIYKCDEKFSPDGQENDDMTKNLTAGGSVDASLCKIVYEIRSYSQEMQIPHGRDEVWFDYGEIKEKLSIRNRQEGDYLLIGKAGHKKSLNRFFIDSKVAEKVRNSVPLLAEGSHVLYVAGLRRDDSYPVTADTREILVVKSVPCQ